MHQLQSLPSILDLRQCSLSDEHEKGKIHMYTLQSLTSILNYAKVHSLKEGATVVYMCIIYVH